jgi:CheY-like chemotaxis protein
VALQETLETAGHSVSAFEDAGKALECFEKKHLTDESYDVVITDLGMPHIDGREVARRIKSADQGTPVILLSGWGSFMNLERDLPEHVDCVLPKPPRLEQLRQAIAALVSKDDT